ncbi:MAG: hypothetical protein IKB98_03070 [Clostridia bacterium]|nr:hypothetical protein [Clostridia bacterium]
MKKLLTILLSICLCLSFSVIFTACNNDGDSENPSNSSTNYTVTEAEWKMNFQLTKGQVQPQACETINNTPTLSVYSSSQQALSQITSYTLFAEGNNEGVSGTSLLKVSPNAMSIEFYVGGTLKESESGVFTSDSDFYIGLTTSVMSYFPFENNYDKFTFNQDKKAYVCQNLTSALNDEYDVNDIYYMYTKSAEVSFVNGYLNKIEVELCDQTFTDVYASYVFTFSDINNTIVSE